MTYKTAWFVKMESLVTVNIGGLVKLTSEDRGISKTTMVNQGRKIKFPMTILQKPKQILDGIRSP